MGTSLLPQWNKPCPTPSSILEYRVYGFKEIACIYYPWCQPRSASRNLRRIIREDKLLLTGLLSRGYRITQRQLTPAQITYLFSILGSPEEFAEIVHPC